MAPDDLTYRSAGVDIDEAGRALRAVANDVRETYNDRVVAGIGGFGGLFRADFPGIDSPVLVSSIDGVGTKTKVAAMVGEYRHLGHDIVNHCVNDILCQGAAPLFFLDYFGISRLEGLILEEVIRGVAEACTAVGTALIGGETAEMPGVYLDGEFDLVGCIVGVVEEERRLPRGRLRPGDQVIGLASNGLHTNGYSLARKALFELGGLSVRSELAGTGSTIGEVLLRPHRCYFNTVHPILMSVEGVKGVAHITGGGLYDNLPRIMAPDTQAVIDRRTWTPPPIFELIRTVGDIADQEMFRVFNMGIGMCLLVDREATAAVLQRLHDAGEAAAVIGEIHHGSNDVQIL